MSLAFSSPAGPRSVDAAEEPRPARPAPVRPVPPPDAEGARMMKLVELAQAGNGEAFGQLYDAYVDAVYRYIYCRVKSHPLAEDLTSETFVRALRRIDSFSWQGRDFGAWLTTISRNLMSDHFKSGSFRLEVITGDVSDCLHTPTQGPEEHTLAELSRSTLLTAMKKLTRQQQECLTLRFLRELSIAETAHIMGKKEGSVKTLQYRAMRSLARFIPAEWSPLSEEAR